MGFVKDITDQMRAEEETLESQNFLVNLLEAIPAPVFYKDIEGRYLGFNMAYEDFFGKSKEELIGKNVFDISPVELATVYHAKDEELFKRLGIQTYETQVKDAQSIFHDVVFNKASTVDSFGYETKNDEKEKIQDTFKKYKREQSHSIKVSKICEGIATRMDFNEHDVSQIRTAGLMHDIGKIDIEEEFNKIKRHPEKGYRIVRIVKQFTEIAKYVLQHHEKWDGTGYPRGLKGEEISVPARIIAVADAYDAMTTNRVYAKALSKEEAINEIKRCSGTQFDPEIVEVFMKILVTEYIT